MIVNDGLLSATPTSYNWSSPEVVLRATSGEPVLSPYWSCTVSFAVLSLPVYMKLMSLIGTQISISLPHPVTGENELFQAWVDGVGVRYDRCGSVEGLDIELSGIVVHIPDVWGPDGNP